MKLNRSVLLAVVMAVGALAVSGCHRSSDPSSDEGSTAAVDTSQADDEDSDGTTEESANMFASARRFGFGRGHAHHPERREGVRRERRELRRDIGRERREIDRDRRELRRDRPWREGDRR